MGDTATTDPTSALEDLITQDQTQLLDLVRDLRNLGISRWIDLPQLIVVGGQTSGKSSVLEAVSRIRFPRGDSLCTTFATEVTLSRAEEETIKVHLRPAPTATPPRKEHVQSFETECTAIEDVSTVIEKAKTHLYAKELSDAHGKNSFLEDTLCIDCASAVFPPLTLVDLPGLINVPNEGQDEHDVQTVKMMVQKYMDNPKSIILAIVNAANDMSDHTILALAKKIDPTGSRTLGIITKPDTVPEGSASQINILRLANNENTQWHLALGWHVVRNQKWEERHEHLDARDQEEQRWFAKTAWTKALSPQSLGIGPLRSHLARLLEQHTRRFLPEVIKEIQDQIAKCEHELDTLGPGRETPRKQRDYLISTSEKFKSLVHLSTEGLYRHPFFDTPARLSFRIRARVQYLNKAFARIMELRGHALGSTDFDGDVKRKIPKHYIAAAGSIIDHNRVTYLHKIGEITKQSAGPELEGLFNPSVVREVFVQKAAKWEAIATAHIDNVWTMVRDALTAMIGYCATVETSQRIMRHIISEAMEKRKELMTAKLKEVLAPRFKCHPMTYDSHFARSVHSITTENQPKEGVKDGESRLWTAEHAFAYVEAYYDLALRQFVDNVAMLSIEMCLLDELEDIFSPSVVSHMTDEKLKAIAGEGTDVEQLRARLVDKRDSLVTALRQCRTQGIASVDELEAPAEESRTGIPCGETVVPSKSSATLPFRTHMTPVQKPKSDAASQNTISLTHDSVSTPPPSARDVTRLFSNPASPRGNTTTIPTKSGSGLFGSQYHPSSNAATFWGEAHMKSNLFGKDREAENRHEATGVTTSDTKGSNMKEKPPLILPIHIDGDRVYTNKGTRDVPFSAYEEYDAGTSGPQLFQSTTAQDAHRKFSLEELRMADYLNNVKGPTPVESLFPPGFLTLQGSRNSPSEGEVDDEIKASSFGKTKSSTASFFDSSTGSFGDFNAR